MHRAGLDKCEMPTRNDIKANPHDTVGWPDYIKATVNNPCTCPRNIFFSANGVM